MTPIEKHFESFLFRFVFVCCRFLLKIVNDPGKARIRPRDLSNFFDLKARRLDNRPWLPSPAIGYCLSTLSCLMDSHCSNLYLSFRMTCVQIHVPVAQWNPLKVNQVQKYKTQKKIDE